MTTPAKKIPDAEWEVHKEAIRATYLGEDKTIDETAQAMADHHNFHPTRAQLVRRLRHWGFDKNIKSGDWHRAVRCRETERRDELVINGRTINAKRLKKRLSRSDFKTEEGWASSASRRASPSLPSPSPSPKGPEPAWDEMPDTPLLTAVRCRDLMSVQSLLDFGAAISLHPESPHHRPFITAVHQGYTLILRALLNACRRSESSGGSTAEHSARGYNALLRRAVNSLNMESTKCLLDCGADIRSIHGMPVLGKMEEPRRRKAMQLVVALVEEGADIDGYSERDGSEPFLCTAIRCENFAVISFLLKRGAEPTLFPSTGMSSPLHLLSRAKDPIFASEALEALLSHGATDTYENVSSVHIPAGSDLSYETEGMLVDLMDGRRPAIFAFRATPTQAACLCARERLLTSLIAAGADVDAPPAREGGFTAVQIACLRGLGGLLDILVAAGGDINAPAAEGFGFTALQGAILGGHDDLARRLLDMGAQVDAPASGGVGLTALQAAAVTGNQLMVRRLLDVGAATDAPVSQMGLTASQPAVHAGDTGMIGVLLAGDPEPTSPDGRHLPDLHP